jgi:hypothetical protein
MTADNAKVTFHNALRRINFVLDAPDSRIVSTKQTKYWKEQVLRHFTIIIPLQLLESSFEEVAEIGYGVGNSYFTLVIGSFYFRNNLYGLFGVKTLGIIGE